MAVSQLDAQLGEDFFVGDPPSDVIAGRLAGVALIGFANKPGKATQLTDAGADAVTNRLAEISTAPRATPHVALQRLSARDAVHGFPRGLPLDLGQRRWSVNREVSVRGCPAHARSTAAQATSRLTWASASSSVNRVSIGACRAATETASNA
jgi:hypothetical protein